MTRNLKYRLYGRSKEANKVFRKAGANGWVGIVLRFLDSRFTKIVHKKEINLQSLVGNAGGYVGLFLGFAVMQVPEMAFAAFVYIKALYQRHYHVGLVAAQPTPSIP